jgi:hypothetical protein
MIGARINAAVPAETLTIRVVIRDSSRIPRAYHQEKSAPKRVFVWGLKE